jgi:hypothetical protein
MTRAPPILVAGAPRTGTSWVASILSRAKGIGWIDEPDREWPNPYALKAKLTLGQYPLLDSGDRAPREYEVLWARTFTGFELSSLQQAVASSLGGREATELELWRALCDHSHPAVSARLRLAISLARPPSRRMVGTRVLAKSVNAPLALEWLAARFRPAMVVVQRHPLNVLASWMELGWGGCELYSNPRIRERLVGRWGLPQLGPAPSTVERLAWEIGLFSCAIRDGAERHQDWVVASHEDLCLDPEGGFRRLYERLGLEWTSQAEVVLDRTNRPGTGWNLIRVAAEQPERWRKRLSPDQVREAWSVLSRIEAPWVERIAAELE